MLAEPALIWSRSSSETPWKTLQSRLELQTAGEISVEPAPAQPKVIRLPNLTAPPGTAPSPSPSCAQFTVPRSLTCLRHGGKLTWRLPFQNNLGTITCLGRRIAKSLVMHETDIGTSKLAHSLPTEGWSPMSSHLKRWLQFFRSRNEQSSIGPWHKLVPWGSPPSTCTPGPK